MSRKPMPRHARQQSSGPNPLQVAEVVGYQAGTNRVDVRISGNRTVRNCIIAANLELAAGDSVLLVRAHGDTRWLAVAKLLDTAEYGQYLEQRGDRGIWPPENFTVTGLQEFIMVEWEAWAGNAVCWNVQSNTQAGGEGATDHYTYGGYLLYRNLPMTTYYFRVRGVHYDTEIDKAYYSGWSSWENAQSPMSGGHAAGQVEQEFDYRWDRLVKAPWQYIMALDRRVKAIEQARDLRWDLHVSGDDGLHP